MTPSAPTKSLKAPQLATTAIKQLHFAFPFLRRAQGGPETVSQFTDEHDIYRLLAEHEQGGEYLVSHQGIWHGGIHVTESGAGQSLDLDAGVRCIADGVLIAFRANKAYPVSDVPASNSKTPLQVPYSTGFALVRHEMEFPRGSKLTFYSLYMHLMANEDYDRNYPKRQKPSYWSRQWTVTDCAKDRQSHRAGQTAEPSQVGLRVRKTPGGHIVGIVPQGASLSIGRKATVHGGTWGQVTDLHGTMLYAPEAGGYVTLGAALNGWIYLGKQNGGPVVKESIPELMFDRVIVLPDPAPTEGSPEVAAGGITVKAGDAIGHLGRFDPLSGNSSGDRRVHIEVFCDDSIVQFLVQSREWINRNCAFKANWDALGLPSEPTILRIGPGTVLYQRTAENRFIPGSDSQSNMTAVVQVYSIPELARNKDSIYTEKDVDAISQSKLSWYQVDSANTLGHAVKGWVREFNHPGGGRVTREFAQDWIDFNALPADAHDPAHTIFAKVHEWVDYLAGASIPELAARVKLSPLMQKIYDALFKTGDGKQAAGELRAMATTGSSGYPWLMLAASRLIAKHESEWAKPSKWQQLFAALKRLSGADSTAQHEAEQQRIDNIVWWEEVKAGISGFPGPDVWHIHPIGLVGNFIHDLRHPFITIQGQRVELLFLRKFNAQSLNEQDYIDAAAELGCVVDAIKAVAKTETGASGPYFKPGQELALGDDQAPAILFERHLFHRATQGKYDRSHPVISNAIQGGYGTKGVQYEKLMEAYSLDSTAALQSTSWGRFQILGSNFVAAGFQNVQDYVASSSESEVNQLRAFVSFINSDPVLRRAMINKNWHEFAMRYNGPAQQGYDTIIEKNYRELSGL